MPREHSFFTISMGFEAFLGNSKVVASLRRMLPEGRVPGALLFSGPEEIGKKTLAVMLAKALNCERLRDDFCGACASCQKVGHMLAEAEEDAARRRDLKDSVARVEGLVYFDVHLIKPLTRYILIEQIRQLRASAYARPFELPRRVFIINDAQTIHWQAADLLLKVLEEPPETTILILVCPNAYDLRSTIRSRCLRFQFAPPDDAVIGTILREEARVPEPQRMLATRVVAGSIARAKNFNFADYESRRRPWLDFLDAVAGRGPAVSPDWVRIFATSKALTEKRDELEGTLRMGATIVSDLLRVSAAGSQAELVNVDLREKLAAWAQRLTINGIEQLQIGLRQAYRLQVRNVNPELGLESLALEVVARQP